MKTIGILYIATGPYIAFWENFYESFEKNFLKNTQKFYYVFTDAQEIYGQERDNVKKLHLDNQPWPLVTLLRFHTFLSIEDELEKLDYLMFSNANIECNMPVTEEEFLPNGKDEQLSFTWHPGYYKNKPYTCVYDRNPKSKAYIPYNRGKYYVIGAMFAGTSQAFLEMSRELKTNINTDLNNRVIAQWHDESHINHYIACHNNWKLLNPGYCYPVGIEVPYERKIVAVPKKTVFDIDKFKGYTTEERSIYKKILDKLGKIANSIKIRIFLVRDLLLNKKVKL